MEGVDREVADIVSGALAEAARQVEEQSFTTERVNVPPYPQVVNVDGNKNGNNLTTRRSFSMSRPSVGESDTPNTSSPLKINPSSQDQTFKGATKGLGMVHNHSESPTGSHSPAFGGTVPQELQEEANNSEVARGSPTFQNRSKSETKIFSPLLEKAEHGSSSASSANKVSKRESLKAQKRNYRKEKKRATKELLSTLKDPSVIVMADWLKVRGSLKSWTKLWCVLKPGLVVLYKSHKAKSGHWVGTILLNTTELIERPSKKDGFCFKLFHPLEQSIWATRGPKGENIGAITQPLPYSYLIFRAESEAAGKCWMDALELALRCSSLLMRSMKDKDTPLADESYLTPTFRLGDSDQLNESDYERHFKEVDGDYKTDKDDKQSEKTDSEKSTDVSDEEKDVYDDDLEPIESPYVADAPEELGLQGDASQTEEVAEENKSLIWALVKQVRPGMDLSKVVLPTFILETRSLLDRFSDYYYHADLLSQAVQQEDAYSRIKAVVRWYIAGFYKKPKGPKKPYNPIIGETFRCYWKHPKTGSRTFYIAEQISHHPPVSAFHVSNRQDGFSISGSVLAKSKFYGNSLSAIMDGQGRLTFLKRGEDYVITMPYAHCKGVLIGTLTMELGGKVLIGCEKTGYKAELEFKLKPFFSSGEASNKISGKIKLGDETLATLDGHWDKEVFIRDKSTGESELFWQVTPDVRISRLKRHVVALEHQGEFESQRLWQQVTEAIVRGDQSAATQEKFILEEAQRQGAKERKAKMEEWTPRLFERDMITSDWVYKYADLRPWDAFNDLVQYENDFIIKTKTRHKTPLVRTTSIMSVEKSQEGLRNQKRQASIERVRAVRMRSTRTHSRQKMIINDSGSSTPDQDVSHRLEESSTDSTEETPHSLSYRTLKRALEPIQELQFEQNKKLTSVSDQVLALQYRRTMPEQGYSLQNRDWMILAILLGFQAIFFWLLK
ncbi:unnamed protein product [Owenia fusiformis]|uniref:Oxysterol-binding protein n=1 Tax=Owenia fusiformis TaxID=6347 RepID=A0A8S4NYK8_OWEFU|nr:unnamed protein product [Owenia fusiformis]